MTTVTVSVKGNQMTSTIYGEGIDELIKVLIKMQDGLKWKLEIYSAATLKELPAPDAGRENV